MKSARDPRHQNRRIAVRELFASSFVSQHMGPLAQEIYKHEEELDKEIAASAPTWPIDKLNRIDLAILRLAVYEMKYTDAPPKVIIDEAVEIAKEFGSESSPSFINGVLGTILKNTGKGEVDEQK